MKEATNLNIFRIHYSLPLLHGTLQTNLNIWAAIAGDVREYRRG